jgi:hypothetical protein
LYADPDPDPAAQINADPCGSGSGYGSGSETLVSYIYIHETPSTMNNSISQVVVPQGRIIQPNVRIVS